MTAKEVIEKIREWVDKNKQVDGLNFSHGNNLVYINPFNLFTKLSELESELPAVEVIDGSSLFNCQYEDEVIIADNGKPFFEVYGDVKDIEKVIIVKRKENKEV